MEKYIKADTVLKFINGCLEHEDKITDTEKAVLTGVKTCVERIPAADVVKVVRCRDCKHYVESDQVNGEFMCVKDADWCVEDGCYYGFTDYPPAEFFCADGERKDGGQDDV